MAETGIALIIRCHDHGRTIAEALESARRQTRSPSELVVIDHGSTDLHTQQVLGRIEHGGHRVVRTDHKSRAAARNFGVRQTSSPCIVLLDAHSRLDPTYLEKTARRLEDKPDLDFVSSMVRDREVPGRLWTPPAPDLVTSLTRGVVHISSLLRRRLWEAVGGFDESYESFAMIDELDFWTSALQRGFRGDVLQEALFEYGGPRSSKEWTPRSREKYLGLIARFYQKHWASIEPAAEPLLLAKEEFLLDQRADSARQSERRHALQQELDLLNRRIAEATAELQTFGQDRVDWGDLRRTTPVSPLWGLDRGRPLDRYYIEGFLDRHRGDIQGRVLEIKDPGYTRQFGGDRVTAADVLDIDTENEHATIVADLTQAHAIPDDTFDCFILTQTLVLIYNVGAALAHAFRILKPGGVLLCTVPAAGRISYEDRGVDGDYWRFTDASVRKLFAGVFPLDAFAITGYGNVLACTAFLYGLALHELKPEELDHTDPFFPLVYGIRAVKPGAARQPMDVRSDARPGAARPAGTGAVLMYHRVARHGRSVTPEIFRSHMTYLRRHCQPMPLSELAAAARAGSIPERAVAVTLDDGYLDASQTAFPVLRDAGVAATFFITGEPLSGEQEFWWDSLDRIFLEGHGIPDVIDLTLAGLSVRLPTKTTDDRVAARQRLNDIIYPLGHAAREDTIETLADWSGIELQPRPSHRAMTDKEVAQLARQQLVTIGAHTRHHLCLPRQDETIQRYEIVANKEELEALTNAPVTVFSFPYGEHDAATSRLVREAGFEVAVTVSEAPVLSGADPLALPRYECGNWDEEAFASRIQQVFGS